MKPIIVLLFIFASFYLPAQIIALEKTRLKPVHVSHSVVQMDGQYTVRVNKDSTLRTFDEATFVRLDDVEFQNGTIEVKVLSKLLPKSPELSRGFIGIAFRINDDNSRFECIYIRPTNGRSSDQVRRNHSIQYFSYPDFKFERLRQEAPGAYESYADMGLNEWIKLKIEVKDAQAKLFINDNPHPSLIVNDLKHGPTNKGAVGLFVDAGTDGFFSDLKIKANPDQL
jgi:hypothetical protein